VDDWHIGAGAAVPGGVKALSSLSALWRRLHIKSALDYIWNCLRWEKYHMIDSVVIVESLSCGFWDQEGLGTQDLLPCKFIYQDGTLVI
jgi:hypothetical protein